MLARAQPGESPDIEPFNVSALVVGMGLEQWLKNLEAKRERIRAIDPHRVTEKFRRTWLFCLGGAAETSAAACGITNCYHGTFMKGHLSAPHAAELIESERRFGRPTLAAQNPR